MNFFFNKQKIFRQIVDSLKFRGGDYQLIWDWQLDTLFFYHRLNGSSSPVLTATSLSYEEAKNSTPTESKPLI